MSEELNDSCAPDEPLPADLHEENDEETPELKPCPFCGSEVELSYRGVGEDEYFWIKCDYCMDEDDVPYIHTTYEDVTTRSWNHRPIEDGLRAEIKQLDDIRIHSAKRIPELRAEIAEEKASNGAIESVLALVKSEYESLEQQLAEANDNRVIQSNSIVELNQQLTDMKRQLSEAQRANLKQRVEYICDVKFYEVEPPVCEHQLIVIANQLKISPRVRSLLLKEFNRPNSRALSCDVIDWLTEQGVE